MTEFEFSEERPVSRSSRAGSSTTPSLITLVQKLRLAKTEKQAIIVLTIVMIIAFILGIYILYVTFFGTTRQAQVNKQISPALRATIPEDLVAF